MQTLQAWLDGQRHSHGDFARMLTAAGIPTSKHAVGKWVRRERTPRREAIEAIARITGGAVSPSAWFGSAHPSPQVAAQ